MTLTFHEDPGHAWLEVGLADLRDVGLSYVDFSGYSYVQAEGRRLVRMYLEEDCDAPKFINAYEAKHGAKPAFDEVFHDPCFIRDLPRNPVGE